MGSGPQPLKRLHEIVCYLGLSVNVTREQEFRRGRKGEGREKRMLSTFHSDQSNKRVIYKSITAAFLVSFFPRPVCSFLYARVWKVSLGAHIDICHSVFVNLSPITLYLLLCETSWTGSRYRTPTPSQAQVHMACSTHEAHFHFLTCCSTPSQGCPLCPVSSVLPVKALADSRLWR